MSLAHQFHDDGVYFLTMTVVGWQEVFTRQHYQDVLVENLKFCIKYKALRIYAYVIMPNHVHLICDSERGELGKTIQNFKAYTAKQLMQLIVEQEQTARRERLLNAFKYYGERKHRMNQFWIHGNHPIMVKTTPFFNQKRDYIEMNPVKAGFVDEPHYWRLSSANEHSPIPVIDTGLIW